MCTNQREIYVREKKTTLCTFLAKEKTPNFSMNSVAFDCPGFIKTNDGVAVSAIEAIVKESPDTNLYAATSGGGTLALSSNRNNSDDGFTILQENDVLGEIRFAGSDGTDIQTYSARIMAEVDGTPGSNNMPGRLEFHTNSGGATTAERLRIGKNGHVSIAGNYTQTSYALQVTGTINATTDVKINGASAATTGKAIAMAMLFG